MTDVRPALLVATDELVDAEVLAAALDLCRLAFGPRFTHDDWAHTHGGVRLLALDGSEVVGHAAVVPRRLLVGERPVATGYVEGVAVTPSQQRGGIGAQLMLAANDVVRRGFELGALSTGSAAFYERLGWERWQGPTYVADGAQRIRTPDEDDGILVLRTPATPALDPTSSLTCDARAGDSW